MADEGVKVTKADLEERLYRRFKGVPGFTKEDATDLIDESLIAHGVSPTSSEDIPDRKVTLVMLYAQSEGAWTIAISVAHYFKYTDGEESVDKSMLADSYRKLARELRRDYEREEKKDIVSYFKVMRRLDRD